MEGEKDKEGNKQPEFRNKITNSKLPEWGYINTVMHMKLLWIIKVIWEVNENIKLIKFKANTNTWHFYTNACISSMGQRIFIQHNSVIPL